MKTKFFLTFTKNLIIAAAFGTQLMGCAVVAKYYVSKADVIPTGAKSSGDIISFSWSDLDLAVQVQNHVDSGFAVAGPFLPLIPFQGKEGTREGYLIIWADLAPMDNTFSFDPGRVVVKFNDGTSVHVKEFVGPSPPWESPRAIAMGCGERRYSFGMDMSRTEVHQEDVKTPQGPIPVPFTKRLSFWYPWKDPYKGHSCFLLGFDIDPSPYRSFVLSIGGIEKAETQYPVPEIKFIKGSTWRFFSVP